MGDVIYLFETDQADEDLISHLLERMDEIIARLSAAKSGAADGAKEALCPQSPLVAKGPGHQADR